MSLPQLLVALGMDRRIEQSTEDIRKVLVLRNNIHPSTEAEAVSLLRTDIFHDWLRPRHCDMLLIEGAPSTSDLVDPSGRVSDKSILCASLISSLARRQPES